MAHKEKPCPKHAPAKHGHQTQQTQSIRKPVIQVLVLELIPMWQRPDNRCKNSLTSGAHVLHAQACLENAAQGLQTILCGRIPEGGGRLRGS